MEWACVDLAGGWSWPPLMSVGLYLHLVERHEHQHFHDPLEHEHARIHDEHHRRVHALDDPTAPHTHRRRHEHAG